MSANSTAQAQREKRRRRVLLEQMKALHEEEVNLANSYNNNSLTIVMKIGMGLIFCYVLGERSETLTNESQLRFRYIYMAKFKEVNACPPPEATYKPKH